MPRDTRERRPEKSCSTADAPSVAQPQPTDPLQAPVPPPPPPRPPRPTRVPGYILTAPTTIDAAKCLQKQVFYTQDRVVLQSIRGQQPVFLYDAEAKELHGVFKHTQDAQMLEQDLTTPPGPAGYQVQVTPLYDFPVSLVLDDIDDLLIWQQPKQQEDQQQELAGSNPKSKQASTSSSHTLSFEPVLGSYQHGALWEAFMKKAKKQHKPALNAVAEEQQQQHHSTGQQKAAATAS